MSMLVISSLTQKEEFPSQVRIFSYTMSLIRNPRNIPSFTSLPTCPASTLATLTWISQLQALAVLGSLRFAKHNMQFHTHMPLPAVPFSSPFIWLAFTQQTKGRAAPLWGFPWSRTPSFVPQQIHFSTRLFSLGTVSLSTLCLQVGSFLGGGPTSCLSSHIPSTWQAVDIVCSWLFLCGGIIYQK